MSDVFISYSRSDRNKARIIAEAIESRGYKVWWDPNIPPGETFDRVIEDKLDRARCVVVLWTETSVKSDWVKTEAAEGKRRNILIPVLVDNVKIPLEFRRIQAFDGRGELSASQLGALIEVISKKLGKSSTLYQPILHSISKREWQTITTIEEMPNFIGDPGLMCHVDFSPDGRILATRGVGIPHNSVHLWDFHSGRLLQVLEPPDSYFEPIFAPDGTLVVAGTSLGKIVSWRVSDGKRIMRWDPEHNYDLWGGVKVVFSPDGRTVFSHGEDRILVLRVSDWTLKKTIKIPTKESYQVNALTVSSDGTMIASSLDKLRIFRISDCKILCEIGGLTDEITDAIFSPNASQIAFESKGSVKLSLIPSGKHFRTLQIYCDSDDYILKICFFPGGQILATVGAKDGIVRFWRVATGEMLTEVKAASNGLSDMALSPDGSVMATGGHELPEGSFKKSIRLWNIK